MIKCHAQCLHSASITLVHQLGQSSYYATKLNIQECLWCLYSLSHTQRTPVPDERKDAKYWARRRKNNDAAKRSRDMRRKKLDVEIKSARDAITDNQKLKQEIDVSKKKNAQAMQFYTCLCLCLQVLKAEINSLRRLLKDANTTLSLWIRARQAAEPNVQVPPMLRGSNSLFVNFPVSTST